MFSIVKILKTKFSFLLLSKFEIFKKISLLEPENISQHFEIRDMDSIFPFLFLISLFGISSMPDTRKDPRDLLYAGFISASWIIGVSTTPSPTGP